MITKDEIQELLHSTETYRVERITSTGDMDKFQEAICAFANDLPNSRKKGYLILGAYDNGGKVGGDVVENIVENIAENIAENIVDSIVEKLSTTRAKIVRIIWKNPKEESERYGTIHFQRNKYRFSQRARALKKTTGTRGHPSYWPRQR